MASIARLGHPDGQPVFAKDVFSRRPPFFCINDGCSARMYIVSMGESRAHFRSASIDDHNYSYCLRQDITFNPDEYDETLFHINDFIKTILAGITKASIHNHNNGGGGSVGTGNRVCINTLKGFYSAYLHYGIHGKYGDCLIGDYLCGYDNYETYKNGFTGFKVVEATYYYAIKEEKAIVFNFPSYDSEHSSHIKVIFIDDKDRMSIVKHCKAIKRFWMRPILIAGDWKTSSNKDIIAECVVNKRTQHAYIVDNN